MQPSLGTPQHRLDIRELHGRPAPLRLSDRDQARLQPGLLAEGLQFAEFLGAPVAQGDPQ